MTNKAFSSSWNATKRRLEDHGETNSSRTQSIVVLVRFNDVGGVARNAGVLVTALRNAGVKVDLYLLEPGEGLLSALSPQLLQGWAGSRRIRRLKQLRTLRRLLRQKDHVAVVSFGPSANLINCFARSNKSNRVVITERGNPWIPLRRSWNRAFLWTYAFADVLVLQTERSASLFRKLRRRPRQIEVVPNAVNPAIPISPPDSTREKVIIGVGRLVGSKRYRDLIDAFHKSDVASEGWRLVVVGDGPERPNLMHRSNALGLSDSVSFPGTVANPWNLMASAAVFVLCSDHEGFPTVLLEAMASGCPIISADCDFGPRDLIDDGVDGLLYPVGDVSRLSDLLVEITQDSQRRTEIADAAQQKMQRYLGPVVFERWMEVLGLREEVSS